MKFIYHFCKSPMEGEEIKAESAMRKKRERQKKVRKKEREDRRVGEEKG